MTVFDRPKAIVPEKGKRDATSSLRNVTFAQATLGVGVEMCALRSANQKEIRRVARRLAQKLVLQMPQVPSSKISS
jgi:hypothetical protein